MPAKVTKLIGLKRPPFLSSTNLIIFAWMDGWMDGYESGSRDFRHTRASHL